MNATLLNIGLIQRGDAVTVKIRITKRMKTDFIDTRETHL